MHTISDLLAFIFQDGKGELQKELQFSKKKKKKEVERCKLCPAWLLNSYWNKILYNFLLNTEW